MNYDASISTDVPLSRVLDGMVIDGTGLDVIVSFLDDHRSQVGEIFRGSAFAYDLYDLAAHPRRVDARLVEYIGELPRGDRHFAMESLANLLRHLDRHPRALKPLMEKMRDEPESTLFRSMGYRGHVREDALVAAGDMDFVELVENASSDMRVMKRLLQVSYLARSIPMARNFLRFSAKAQFVALMSLMEAISGMPMVADPGCSYLPSSFNTFLKQLLVLNETETFNWVMKVVDFRGRGRRAAHALARDILTRIPHAISRRLPGNLLADREAPWTFEETVFEMNMLGTQFDTLDLFIYMYAFDDRMSMGMEECPELIEFFNLPMEWRELEGCLPSRRACHAQ